MRHIFKKDYERKYRLKVDIYGIQDEHITEFVKEEFEATTIKTELLVQISINNSHPVMATIMTPLGKHEQLIVAYNPSYRSYACINPGHGGYENHSFSDFIDNCYEIVGLK